MSEINLNTPTPALDNLTTTQRAFVHLDRQYKAFKKFQEDYAAASAAVLAEIGEGKYFQDDKGIVYKPEKQDGHFVYYRPVKIRRTRRLDEGEIKGSYLSAKECREAGFIVEGK